ncbi:MAG: PA0069 family radical SAM protein [bacterium]
MAPNPGSVIKGRGSAFNPVNRFEKLEIEIDPEYAEAMLGRPVETEFFLDTTRQILARNDSPDVSFDYSINPYRGCEHGCIYCYARPTHEYFGLSAGLDFETKILVKRDAPRLLEQAFCSRRWVPQLVVLSGNTDCYQPVERELRLTRECLQVFLKYRNPVGILTKNALILRDLDLLQQLARDNLVTAAISVTTLDHGLARKMEPRTASPEKRLDALERLVRAGVPASVYVAPVIPGLNDHEIPAILKAAADRGVRHAVYILLRLPHSLKELVQRWLQTHYPARENKVLNLIRDTRAGQLNDPCFSRRKQGTGARAEAIKRIFELSCQTYGLNQKQVELETRYFRRVSGSQRELF